MAEPWISIGVFAASSFLNLLLQPTRKVKGQEPNFRAPRSSYGVAHPLIFNTGRTGGNFVDPRKQEEIYEKVSTTENEGKGGGTEVEKIETFGTAIALLAGGEYNLKQLYLSNEKRFDDGASGTESDATGQNFLDEYVFFGSGSLTQPAWSVIDAIHQANTDEATQTYRGNAFIGLDRIPLRGEDFNFGDTLPAIEAVLKTTTTYDLQDIVDEIMGKAGIPSTEYDTSELDGIAVKGYLALRDGSSYAEDLTRLGQSYFIFPAKDATGVVKWRSLKRPPSEYHTIPIADLACHPSGDSRPFNFEVEETDSNELPGKAIISSFDPDLNYETGTTEIFYPLGDSENVLEVDTRGVFTEAERETIARTLLQQAWARRRKYSKIFLTPDWLEELASGDVIELPLNDHGETALVQIDRIRISAQDPPLLEVEGSSYDPTALDQTYSAASPARESPPIEDGTLGAAADVFLLDIPKISENDPDTVLYAVTDKDCDLFVSRDGGTTFNLAANAIKGVTGACDTTLGNFSPTFGLDGSGGIQYNLDTSSTLTVTLNNGTLSTVSDTEFQNAANLAFVGREIGGKLEGELILFRDAVNQGGGQYIIDHFIRGWAGTEFNSNGFHTSGEIFILLRGAGSEIVKLQGQQSDLGKTFQFKARLEPFQNLSGITAETITIAGNATKPYALTDVSITADGSGNLYIRALPRLLLEPFGYTGPFPDPGANYGGEQYEVAITGGSTLIANGFPIVYSTAQQIADFGSLQTSLAGTIAQLNLTYATTGFSSSFSLGSFAAETASPDPNSWKPTWVEINAGGAIALKGGDRIIADGTSQDLQLPDSPNELNAVMVFGKSAGSEVSSSKLTGSPITIEANQTYRFIYVPLDDEWVEAPLGGGGGGGLSESEIIEVSSSRNLLDSDRRNELHTNSSNDITISVDATSLTSPDNFPFVLVRGNTGRAFADFTQTVEVNGQTGSLIEVISQYGAFVAKYNQSTSTWTVIGDTKAIAITDLLTGSASTLVASDGSNVALGNTFRINANILQYNNNIANLSANKTYATSDHGITYRVSGNVTVNFPAGISSDTISSNFKLVTSGNEITFTAQAGVDIEAIGTKIDTQFGVATVTFIPKALIGTSNDKVLIDGDLTS